MILKMFAHLIIIKKLLGEFIAVFLEFSWSFLGISMYFHFLFGKCHFLVGNLIFISLLNHNWDQPRSATGIHQHPQLGSPWKDQVDPPRTTTSHHTDPPGPILWIHHDQSHGSTSIHYWDPSRSTRFTTRIQQDQPIASTLIHQDPPLRNTRIHHLGPPRSTIGAQQDQICGSSKSQDMDPSGSIKIHDMICFRKCR